MTRRRCPHDGAVLVDGHCYLCCKRRSGLIAGGRTDDLTREQETFVGLYGIPRSERGWQPPSSIPALASFIDEDTGEPWMSDEDLRLFQMLVDPPTRGLNQGDEDES